MRQNRAQKFFLESFIVTQAATDTRPRTTQGGIRVRVQKFGTFLSSMIMPNIGAFIAWGIITALFIPDGYFPNEKIATLVSAMVFYLLPILIAYSGGRLIYDVRGGVVGAIATMGVIMGTSSEVFLDKGESGSPMFLGAMICGPLFAWLMKKLDALWDGKIKPGFEMLVSNFSAGIFAALGAIASMFLLTPVMNVVMAAAARAVEFLISNNLLFLTSILIEPAKVLFLNNAINHGILTPLGTEQAVDQGYSLLFLLEANPGPGLGILLAYTFFGRGSAKATAPGAAIIHFFGGIHEIYFPYVLMKPVLIVAAIAGGMAGIFTETLLGAGLGSTAAPGSIIAILGVTAPGKHIAVIAGVLMAAVVSGVIASLILKFSKTATEDLHEATQKMQQMKGKKSAVASSALGDKDAQTPLISRIVFACDAGMGSSAMGASVLRNKINDAGFGKQVSVVNCAINNLTDSYDLLICHEDLVDRAQAKTPSAMHITVDNFMASPRYDEIVALISSQRQPQSGDATPVESPAEPEEKSELLRPENIILSGSAGSRDEAIEEAGALLVRAGAVDASYVAAMHEREASVSTFMGNGLAIPHGTNETKQYIKHSALAFVRYEQPVDWGGKEAHFVIAIAGADGSHLKILSKIAKLFAKKDSVQQLHDAATQEDILDIFGKVTA
ncbi:PTS mannitol transporter subunit IICBA [Corynebacterium sp. sy039]|uniref:PTS mannitol transporter subunit IICBA n=1 Tax=Corynebacterium sp. sy039 TaxID=2599641 RepID=UPI0011B54CC4|nr:PTS mannitol transporter subunit IICBA [Corynebacterium sp. sy039]QDZ41898.1 PTS mannitol transporter subunit IICBA [Corynebacterium sp. sy039]